MFKRLSTIIVILAAIAWGVWNYSVTLQERCLIALLLSGIPPVQEIVAKELHEYPSQTTALSLIAFVNLHAPTGRKIKNLKNAISHLEETLEDESIPKEEKDAKQQQLTQFHEELKQAVASFDAEYPRRKKLANAGLRSLSYLSGESFGTRNKERANFSGWTILSKSEWDPTVTQMNYWALQTFSKNLLEAVL